MLGIFKTPEKKSGEKQDMATCHNCQWSGPVSSCKSETRADDTTGPSYTADICPKCGEVIQDYWPSPEWLQEHGYL